MFVRLLSARQVVLLCDSTKIRLFYQGEVYHRQTADGFWGLPKNPNEANWAIWTLVDVDNLNTGPKFEKTDNVWLVQAPSPNPNRWKYWGKQYQVSLLGATLWNVEELMRGYTFSLFSPVDAHR